MRFSGPYPEPPGATERHSSVFLNIKCEWCRVRLGSSLPRHGLLECPRRGGVDVREEFFDKNRLAKAVEKAGG